jgi:capsular polysaccharide biosynthesis protein
LENFRTQDILAILARNKKALIIVTVIAAVTSTAVSYLLKPKYKSYAVVYPVNLSPSSEESNTEQLLQHFNSEEVKNAVAKKLGLYEHYKIDTTGRGSQAMFDLYFKEHVSISPTLYESINIEVKDTDPKMARDMVQALIDETNALIMNLKQERLLEYYKNMQMAILDQKGKVDSLTNSIIDIQKKYNILDIGYQSRYISKGLVSGQALNDESKNTAEGIKTKTSVLRGLNLMLDGQLTTMNYFRDAKDKYITDFNSKISFTNIVSRPTLPDKKCFPIRWLIVSVSTGAAFALACLYFILSNSAIRKVD